eukprot:15338039-Ditylum_brightwellii.AAC.1
MAQVGTTLCVLEEGTPWANRSKLYVGLFKQAVRKNMKESNCSLKVISAICVDTSGMTAKFPFNQEVLSRLLGPDRGEGHEMTQWVLKANEKVVPRRTCRPLHTDKIHSEQEKKKHEVFDALIDVHWGYSFKLPVNQEDDVYDPYEEEDEKDRPMLDIKE